MKDNPAADRRKRRIASLRRSLALMAQERMDAVAKGQKRRIADIDAYTKQLRANLAAARAGKEHHER